MNCTNKDCFGLKLTVITDVKHRCNQKTSTNDTRPCLHGGVAFCSRCGQVHCAKHVPSRNLYDRKLVSP